MLDLDDVSAQNGELIGGERAGQNVGDVDNADSSNGRIGAFSCGCDRYVQYIEARRATQDGGGRGLCRTRLSNKIPC